MRLHPKKTSDTFTRISRNSGFSLIEIIVVITVIGVVATIGIASYSQFIKQSRDARRRNDLETLRTQLETYKAKSGGYPQLLDGLVPDYASTLPTDPTTGDGYQYIATGCTGGVCTSYELYATLDASSGNVYKSTPLIGMIVAPPTATPTPTPSPTPTLTPTQGPSPIPTPTPASTGLSWEFNTTGNLEGWKPTYNLKNVSVGGGTLQGSNNGNDPQIYGPTINISASSYNTVTIRMKNQSSSSEAQLFFLKPGQSNWIGGQGVTVTINPNSDFTEYTFAMTTNSAWNGTITDLRFDPNSASTGSFAIDYIRVTSTPVPAIAWEFNGSLDGWYCIGCASSSIVNGEWWGQATSSGGGEAWSPLFSLDADRYKKITIRFRNASWSPTGFVYYYPPNGWWYEAKSFSTVPWDPGITTYTIDMSTQADWRGTMARIKFYLFGGGPNHHFGIDYIRISE